MKRFRVANIKFHSALPYRVLASLENVQYLEQTPVDNARALAQRQLDLAHIPISEFAVHGGYVGIDFGLASRERIDSIMFYAGCDIRKVRTIFLDEASSSAVGLLRLLLIEKFKVAPSLIRIRHQDLEKAVGRDSGVLVIGNKAINWQGKFPFQMDPSTAWYEHTGLPFVYSIWATRPGLLDKEDVTEFQDIFHKATTARSFLAEDFASELEITEDAASAHIADTVVYYLDDRCREGMREYLKRAARHRLIPYAEYQSASYNIINRSSMGLSRRRTMDSILQDRLDGKRISIADSLQLAKRAELSELSLATELLHSREKHERELFVQLETSVDRNGELPETALNVPYPIDRVGLRFSDPFLINIKTVERVVESVVQRFGAAVEAFTPAELASMGLQSGRSLEEVIARLTNAGVHSIRPAIEVGEPDLEASRLAASKYLQAIRWLNRMGGSPSVSLALSAKGSWEDRLAYLAELRLIEDETPGIINLYLKPEPALNGLSQADYRMRAIMITRIFMDNIKSVYANLDPAQPSAGLLAVTTGIDGVRMEIDCTRSDHRDVQMTQLKLATLGISPRTAPPIRH